MRHDQILRAARVREPEANGQVELVGIVVEPQRRQRRATVLELHLRRVDLRDEELHPRGDVRLEERLRARRDLVLLFAQPGVEPRGVFRRQDHDLVLAHRELRLDRDAVVALARRTTAAPGADTEALPGAAGRPRVLGLAGVALPVLDQPRRAHLIDVREDLLRQRLHVRFLQHRRHRDHHRERFWRPLVVVLHRQHGARAERMSTTCVASLNISLPAPFT
jgi:hypothetical protein